MKVSENNHTTKIGAISSPQAQRRTKTRMVALSDFVSTNVLLVAFFTALLSSALDQYPSPFEPEPVDTQYALRTVAQQTRFEQTNGGLLSSLFSRSSPLYENAQVLFPNEAFAVQDLAISADGRAFVGLADGRIASFRNDDLVLRDFARTGTAFTECGSADATLEIQIKCGRPAGLVFSNSKFLGKYVDRIPGATLFAGEQVLLVADAFRGVYLFDANGKKTLLFNAVKKEKLNFVNGLAVTARGDIYVTDSSRTFKRNELEMGLLERANGTGQLVHFSPTTAVAKVIANDLAFPNGLVLVDNDSALLVALSTQNKVVRYTFSSKSLEDFAFTPGEPSGLAVNSMGDNKDALFVGLFAPANVVEDFVMRSVKVRKLLSLLPEVVTRQYLGLRSSFATVDLKSGDVIRVYEEKLGKAPWISNVRKFGEFYYLTSWQRHALVRVPVAALTQ